MTAKAGALLNVRCVIEATLPVEREGFERLCRRVGTSAGALVEPRYARGERELVAELEEDATGTPTVLIPGAFGDSAAVAEAAVRARTAPLVWLDLAVASTQRRPKLDPMRVASIRGRGLEGLLWAVRSVAARAARPPVAERYGEDVEQFGELRVPDVVDRPAPVCVLLHGGGWRERWERDLMDGLAVDLTDHGYATWNLEYRRVGPSGGGWPATFEDVAAGVDHVAKLADRYPLDPGRVLLIGHSAGAHLALWAAGRARFAPGTPGAGPTVLPALAVSLAGVQDLETTAARGTDEMSTIALMGGMPDQHPEAYSLASPLALLPLGIPQLVVWGTDDRPDLVDENRRYCPAAAAAGDEIYPLELPGGDHFTVIDPATLSWIAIRERLLEHHPPASPAPPSKEGVTRDQAHLAGTSAGR
jgi:acetyl esterase/lipase